jgi:HK97 family phage major capsid protein
MSTSTAAVRNITKGDTRGDSFVRLIKCYARAKGSYAEMEEHADAYRHSNPEIPAYVKAAVAAGSLSDISWAGPLGQFQSILGEFLALVSRDSLIGRMMQARRVGLRSRFAIELQAGASYWRSESSTPKPLTLIQFGAAGTLDPRTGVCIIAVTDELLEMSRGEQALKGLLVRSLASFLDASFLDPSFATSADAPTSITSGQTTVTPTGTTAALIKADLRTQLVAVASAVPELIAPTYMLSPLTAGKLALVPDSSGGIAFPGINAVTGGMLGGIPVLISAAARSADSPSDDQIVLVDQSQVLVADEGEMRVSIAREASLQMDSAPSAGPQNLVSLFQHGLTAIRVERIVNWQLARQGAAASLTVTF